MTCQRLSHRWDDPRDPSDPKNIMLRMQPSVAERTLARRHAGATLQQIASEEGVSRQAVHGRLQRGARRHIQSVVLDLWLAQKQDQLLTLAIPAWVDRDDEARVLAYLGWVLAELPHHGVEPRVHYRPALDGGCCFAIEDATFRPRAKGEIAE